jgi:hypothetical protein
MFIIDDIFNAIFSNAAADAQKREIQKAERIQWDARRQNDAAYAGTQRRQQDIYNQGRADQMPWLEAGRSTLADLVNQMQTGSFDKPFDPSMVASDPGFQFRMAEGQKALERSAAARGGLNSGGFMKGLARYSQGLASDEYQNAWNRNRTANMDRFGRMSALAGMGQQSAQNLGALGSSYSGQLGGMHAQNSAQTENYANNISNLKGAYGNADAAGIMGVGNGVAGGFRSLGNLAMLGAGVPPVGMMGGAGTTGIPTQSGGGGGNVAYNLPSGGYGW